MEGSGLWNKVDVRRKWNVGGKGRNMRGDRILRRVIGFAEDVTFSNAFSGDKKHVMSVGGWLAPNLRILKLPSECVLPTFFPTLVSKCPLLESLVVEGTVALGNDPVHIRHPNLKSLKFYGRLPLVLTVDCLALTHLSTLGKFDYTGELDSYTLHAPSLFCTRLKSLCLSRIHCAKGVLEAVAAHAPNITSLESYVTNENPFSVLTQFKALQVLKIRNCKKGKAVPSNAFTSWPLLESLRLDGHDFANDIEVAHVGLKSLEICDSNAVISLVLSCISLEYLKLSCEMFEAGCLKNLDQSCPNLKRVQIGRYWELDGPDVWVDGDEADGPMEIFHERLEKLELRSISRSSVHVACTNLKKLVMTWGVHTGSTFRWNLSFPTLVCPRLKSLELYFFDHMFRSIPGILSVLPCLESLRCDCARGDLKDVVLEHQNIRDIILVTQMRVRLAESEFNLKRLTLIMPSLEQVEVVESIKQLQVVASSEKVVVKYT